MANNGPLTRLSAAALRRQRPEGVVGPFAPGTWAQRKIGRPFHEPTWAQSTLEGRSPEDVRGIIFQQLRNDPRALTQTESDVGYAPGQYRVPGQDYQWPTAPGGGSFIEDFWSEQYKPWKRPFARRSWEELPGRLEKGLSRLLQMFGG